MKHLLAGFIAGFLPLLSAAQGQVEPIPLGTRVAVHPEALTFPGGRPEAVEIEIQLSDVRTGEPEARPGELYFTSSYPGIVYPEQAALDAGGFARVRLVVRPPTEAERRELGGRILVFVVIDAEDADDTIEGRIVLTLPAAQP